MITGNIDPLQTTKLEFIDLYISISLSRDLSGNWWFLLCVWEDLRSFPEIHFFVIFSLLALQKSFTQTFLDFSSVPPLPRCTSALCWQKGLLLVSGNTWMIPIHYTCLCFSCRDQMGSVPKGRILVLLKKSAWMPSNFNWMLVCLFTFHLCTKAGEFFRKKTRSTHEIFRLFYLPDSWDHDPCVWPFSLILRWGLKGFWVLPRGS